MNKTITIIIAVLILGSGAAVLLSGSESDQQDPQMNNNVVTESSQNSQTAQSTADPGGFVEYSEANLANAEGTSRIVFFHAPWCSTCNFFEGQIEKTGVPDGITILKADYDNDTELKKLYGVVVQSTFVLLDDNGEVAETWPFASGLRNIQDLYDAVI